MPSMLDLELANTAHKIINDLAKIKKGESVLITIDGLQEWRVAEETAKAAEVAEAKVMVAWHSTPPGYGKVGDPFLPDPLKSAIPNTDVWIEFNNQWLLFTSAWEEALKTNRVRHLFLGGLNRNQAVRCIGNVNIEIQAKFQKRLVEITAKSRKMRVTTPAGTDVTFENDPQRPVRSEIFADKPGAAFLLGQIAWAPIEESINGTIVFDGSFSGGGEADIGILKEYITLKIEKGVVTDIRGGREAVLVKSWLKSLDHPNMYKMAHICYGFNPGARLSGLCTEDERVWGCTEWGMGYQGPHLKGILGEAPSHADGICLDSSVWLDDKQIMKNGKLLEPDLAEMAKKLGRE
ncbi:aminopeptidase [[Eubacterium] cellulosolvens]